MAREPHGDGYQRAASDDDEPQPQRPYEHLRDYFKLARFRMDFGAKHNPQEFWERKGGDDDKRRSRR